MDRREWLDKLAEAVCGRIRGVEVRNVDADTMTLAYANAVCTVHVVTNKTVTFLVSYSGDGTGAARIQHGERLSEVMDDVSLGTLPPLIAGWLRSE